MFANVVNEKMFLILFRIYTNYKYHNLNIIRTKIIIRQHNQKKYKLKIIIVTYQNFETITKFREKIQKNSKFEIFK